MSGFFWSVFPVVATVSAATARRGPGPGAEPNPPSWPSNVYVFDPNNPSYTQSIVNQVFAENGGHDPAFNGQWSNDRYAFLFQKGTHPVSVPVGYYTSVLGTGLSPRDVEISSVYCENGDFDYTGGALSNFWRSAENFYTRPTMECSGITCMMWAVSQAAPLRRVYVDGNVQLWEYNYGCCAGYASGGFMADSIVTGTISSGSQQQWLSRNVQMGSWDGGVWNMVFLGCENGEANKCNPYTSVDYTPVIAEKPFIHIDDSGKYHLAIPPLEFNKKGPTANYDNVTLVDFSNVFVATDSDDASTINDKLSAGLHVVLSPGNYVLSSSIQVSRDNAVLLGIGFPVVECANGDPAIVVGNVDGVRIGGILLQANKEHSASLLTVGTQGYNGTSQNPTILHDVFARVGGPNDSNDYQVSTDVMVVINSGNAVYDNSWLWRADHDSGGEVYDERNPVNTGLQVNGDSVRTYGLASEHTLGNLVEWNAENGECYFYQSELPYDCTQENYGDKGYVSYRVADNVQTHRAFGVGTYSYFRDASVTVNSGIKTGSSSRVTFVNSLSVFLNGNGQISHVINNEGAAVNSGNQIAYVC